MVSTTTLALVDGVRIVVPDSLNLITPYVLVEQNDWFEDEIKFLRRLLRPGQQTIDIGANYGVYTLSMARTVGPAGRIWAFEPASSTAAMLAEALSLNGFSQVVLERSALSSSCGTGQLSLNGNSELNSLAHDESPGDDDRETVPLVTLDDCLDRYGWRDIDFLKIDAEGEETNILRGGERFFAELSPLVQYEIKAGGQVHMELVQQFAALGYNSYRLVPGLNLLVPFEAEAPVDGYLLNVFCCKSDQAQRLVAQGFLLDSAPSLLVSEPEGFEDISRKVKNCGAYGWRDTVAKLPYGGQLASLWEKTVAAGNSSEVEEALSCYAFCRDPSQSSADRFRALTASFKMFESLSKRRPSRLRYASLARVTQDYGARAIAVNALQHLSSEILQHNRVDPSEPFLAPSDRFDSIDPREAIGNWILAAVLEDLESLTHYSSFYTGQSARQRLERIDELGFGSAEMGRRLRLLERRFGRATA